jgi:hypothetical protein
LEREATESYSRKGSGHIQPRTDAGRNREAGGSVNQETTIQNLQDFIKYASTLSGDEKGEAQVFCDRLFKAFGHEGYKEAGATLEHRVRRKEKRTRFADLLWKPRLLIEMKSSRENLQLHYRQAFEYWIDLVPHRPRYVILCNFREFWIYDFDSQLDDPVDRIQLEDLPRRYTALNFLFPKEKKPLFGNNRVDVTREAADKVARIFNSLTARGEDRARAQRFILQIVVAMFSEDVDLLPRGLLLELLQDCRQGSSSYDLIGGLFRQMNTPERARGGKYTDVDYFNGGLFRVIDPIDLKPDEIDLLTEAAQEDWSRIQPAIFGTLFQSSMDKEERHAYGAHFTSEADIQRVVLPTIVKPWRERIEQANTLKDLLALREEIQNFHVLDPACGSGNFLYVAYRELNRIELELLAKIHANFGARAKKKVGTTSLVSIRQFHGIDIQDFGVELAKVTLLIAKELALKEAQAWVQAEQVELSLSFNALPLDNLDENIRCDDALFSDWPRVQAIIGNPPYQSKNKMQQEFGPEYVRKVRERYPNVPGRADYCVYWFRRAHDELPSGGRAGLVGTNTVRQGASRQGGLDYIVQNRGTINDAVSSQVWPGESVVHVSIVNWVKGPYSGEKRLSAQIGDSKESPWTVKKVELIHASLSDSIDVTGAVSLHANVDSQTCYQGQTHGHAGFLLSLGEAEEQLRDERNRLVLFPFLIGSELVGNLKSQPRRYVIDFGSRDLLEARTFPDLFNRISKIVLPSRQRAEEEEATRNAEVLAKDSRARVNLHHRNFLNKWWQLSYPRREMMQEIEAVSRYVACSGVTKRPIFEFIHSSIHPNAKLQVFVLDDDYSFGILQSGIHWEWFKARCTTLKSDWAYTSDTIFDSFPWPQSSSENQVKQVAATAVSLRALRRDVMSRNKWTFRELYRTLDVPGENPLRQAHNDLDKAVRNAYGMKPGDDTLAFLLRLNQEVADRESQGLPVSGPGLPAFITDKKAFVTDDCVRMSENSNWPTTKNA